MTSLSLESRIKGIFALSSEDDRLRAILILIREREQIAREFRPGLSQDLVDARRMDANAYLKNS